MLCLLGVIPALNLTLARGQDHVQASALLQENHSEAGASAALVWPRLGYLPAETSLDARGLSLVATAPHPSGPDRLGAWAGASARAALSESYRHRRIFSSSQALHCSE